MTDQVLRFRGDARTAALLLIDGTSLSGLSGGVESNLPLRVHDWGQSLEVTVSGGWGWSSGELVLLDLLHTFATIDLSDLDERTAQVAFRALVTSVGGFGAFGVVPA